MALLETCLAKPHGWLASIHSRLVHAGKRPRIYGLQVIALLLSIPIFHACNVLFKFAYAAQVRRMKHISFHKGALSIQDVPLNVYDRRVLLGLSFERNKPMRDIASSFEAIVSSLEHFKHNPPADS